MKLTGRKGRKELAAAIAQGREFIRAEPDDDALEFLGAAVKRFPDDPELRLFHATVLSEPELVAAEAAKAAELAPDDPAILVRAGHQLLSAGDEKTAQSCAARANELVQADFVLMAGLDQLNGLLAAFAGGADDLAEEKLRSAVRREPSNDRYARYLAVFLAERGRPQEGAEVLEEALKHVEHTDDLVRLRDRMAAEAADS